MDRQVRYCAGEDGTQIAYCVEGSGQPLVIAPYFFESFARDEDVIPEWPDLLRRIGAGRQVVRYDMRGSGMSQRDDVEISHAGNLSDLQAVVEAAGLGTFDLLGWVTSGPTAIEFAARHPEKVKRLILYAAFARTVDAMPADALAALAALCRTNWPLASQTFVDMSWRQETPDLVLQQAEIWRQTLSGETLARTLELGVDVTEMLRSVKAPTLVLHRVNDSSVPLAAGQKLASSIPNARLVPLKGSINYPALGDQQSIADAITAFLKEGEPAPEPVPEPAPPSTSFRTILFTDMAGHTEMMGRLGDEAGREVLREHERVTREALHTHNGSEIKTMGDGFMASFSSATKALECAIGIQRAFASDSEPAREPISVRVGINAGEPIAEDDDLFGTAVILAARIAAQADGGEIFVSEGVRQIVAGKRFLFSDRGDTALRGYEDPVRVYEVNWRT